MKTFLTNLKKISLIILLFLVIFLLPKVMQFAKYAIDEDDCVDSGICAEGLKFGDEIMSKEYCLKKGKKWDDKRKEYDMAIESRTCRDKDTNGLQRKVNAAIKLSKIGKDLQTRTLKT